MDSEDGHSTGEDGPFSATEAGPPNKLLQLARRTENGKHGKNGKKYNRSKTGAYAVPVGVFALDNCIYRAQRIYSQYPPGQGYWPNPDTPDFITGIRLIRNRKEVVLPDLAGFVDKNPSGAGRL